MRSQTLCSFGSSSFNFSQGKVHQLIDEIVWNEHLLHQDIVVSDSAIQIIHGIIIIVWTKKSTLDQYT